MIHRLKEEIRSEYDALLIKINRKLNENNPYQPIQPDLSSTQLLNQPISISSSSSSTTTTTTHNHTRL